MSLCTNAIYVVNLPQRIIGTVSNFVIYSVVGQSYELLIFGQRSVAAMAVLAATVPMPMFYQLSLLVDHLV